MAGKHVVVTLTPVYLPDTLPFRTLTFADDDDCVSVGRASKSETKQLVPAHNNAWFDSRVMSRNHALICASLSNKKVLLSDNGSMHGTYINDEQVPLDEEVEIKSGDVLTFGNEVTRWPKDGRPRDPVNPFALDTFSPLKVRCECEWFDDSAEEGVDHKEKSHDNSRNSFSVPEEGDDEGDDEVIPETLPTKPRVFSPIHFTIPHSEAEESEDESEEEQDTKSSPPTSHPEETKASAVHETEKDSEPKPSVNDSNNDDMKPPSEVSTTEDARYRVLAARVAEVRRMTGLGPEECRIDIEDGRIITPMDRWMADQKKNPDLLDYWDRMGSGDSDVNLGLRESSEPEIASERQWRAREEPESQPEKHADEQDHAQADAVLPSTPESISGSHEKTPLETDSENESNDDCDVSVNHEEACESYKKALFTGLGMGYKKTDDPVDYYLKSPLVYPPKPSPRHENFPEVEAFKQNCGYEMDHWRGHMLGTLSDLPRRVPSPSDKALANPLDAENVGRNRSITSSWVPYQPPSRLPRATDYIANKEESRSDSLGSNKSLDAMSRPYYDGPFQGFREPDAPAPGLVDFTPSKAVPQVHPATAQASQHDPIPPWHHEEVMSCNSNNLEESRNLDSSKPEAYGVAAQMHSWRAETEARVSAAKATVSAAKRPVTRMSIADIVAGSDRKGTATHVNEKGLKRKASEMEEEPELPVHENGAKDAMVDGNGGDESLGLTDSFPDAQPRNVVQGAEYSASQLTELSTSKEDVQTPDEEPPRKRMKMTMGETSASRPKSSFAKYAATALAGAAIGGVGTLAALVALPPDFFA